MLAMNLSSMAQQRITYAYDDAGNRIKREIVLSRGKYASKKTIPDASYYDSVGYQKIKISPSPSGIIDVSFLHMKPSDSGCIEVYSVGGEEIFRQDISSDKTEVDISGQPRGIYILRIIVNDKPTTWKITKE